MEQKNEPQYLENISRAMNIMRDYVLQVLSFMLFRTTRRFLVTFQKFTWAVTGVERIRRDARRGLQFRQSAHVQEIFWKRKFIPTAVADPSDFITTHKCFKHPNCVLKQTVSLYCMTKNEAVFIEVDEGVDIFQNPATPFFYDSQFQHARRLITMPLASFHKIASDVGNPRVPVTWLSSTPRSGSTLLGRMLQHVPGMLVISEPDVITTLGTLNEQKALQEGEYSPLLASAVKLLCKPDDRCSMMCIKARPAATRLSEDVAKLFPQIRQIFMYRNSLKTVASCLNVLAVNPASMAMRFLLDSSVFSTVLPFFRRAYFRYYVGLNAKKSVDVNPSKLSAVGIFTAAWAAGVARITDCRDKGIHINPILYEDLMMSPRKGLAKLFEYLDIRREYLGQALEASKEDQTMVAGTSLLPSETRRSIPPEARSEADAILKKYGLPKLGERYEITGLERLAA